MKPEPFDPDTGEVLHTPVERAVDGALIPVPARTGGQMIDLLEDGALGAELHNQLADVAQSMKEHSDRTGMKCKGQVVVVLDLERDGDAFRVQGDIKAKKPKIPRPRSTVWADREGNFTRFPPGQHQFFGVKSV